MPNSSDGPVIVDGPLRLPFPARQRRTEPIQARVARRASGLFGLVVANGNAAAQPEQPSESFVVIMAAEPVVAYDGGEPGLAATAPETGEKVEPEAPEVEAYVEHLEGAQDEVLAEAGVPDADVGETFTFALNGFEADLTAVQVAELERRPEVGSAAGTGALEIVQAPDSASIGAFDTVTASWSGLDSDLEYGGAVAHANADGLIGLTIVDITT